MTRKTSMSYLRTSCQVEKWEWEIETHYVSQGVRTYGLTVSFLYLMCTRRKTEKTKGNKMKVIFKLSSPLKHVY